MSNAHLQFLGEEYQRLGKEIKRLEEQRKEALAQFVDEAGQEEGIHAGFKLTLVTTKGRVAWSKLAKALDISEETQNQYRGEGSVFWKLS